MPGVLQASETGQLETVPGQVPKWVDKESNLPLKDTVDVRLLVGKRTGFRKKQKDSWDDCGLQLPGSQNKIK